MTHTVCKTETEQHTGDMDWDLFDRCIEALESGAYEQGCGALRNGDVYCALGVFVDVAYGPGVWRGGYDGELYYYAMLYCRGNGGGLYYMQLDPYLKVRLGLDGRLGIDQTDVHAWNDNDMPFDAIAGMLRLYKQLYLDRQK